MITDNKKWYLSMKKLSALFWGIKSNYGDVYCINCLHSNRTKNKL